LKKSLYLVLWLWQYAAAMAQSDTYYLLRPDRLFDGNTMRNQWSVLVKNNRIEAVAPHQQLVVPQGTQVIDLSGMTLLPGFIEGHSHVLLHPYNETSWDDQVLRESLAMRIARATVHLRQTLEAGFTTVRDLGTEGADYEDVGLKRSVEVGIIPGPRMLVATRALIATGSYAPKGFAPHVSVPQGAEEADGHDAIIKAVRTQIGKGADLIKLYADYRWGLGGEAMPTYTEDEIRLMVTVAGSSGRPVVAHASTLEGMRRAVMAGVNTIEHGDNGTPEVFRLMRERQVALCPTLAAGDAILQYRGWKKGQSPEPERIVQKRKSFRQALEAGVTICFGGDVGVFSHGDNAREMEMMVEYGMPSVDVLRSATAVNAQVFGLPHLGRIEAGFLADLVAVKGNPAEDIRQVRQVQLVMKNGILYKKP
jgi:imidazolonepropionase-like amidohydrolase